MAKNNSLEYYNVHTSLKNFMYIGTLDQYYYENDDIGNLLIFLKKFQNKKIFLIDNLMCEFDYEKIPLEFDLYIIGIFGEVAHKNFLENLLNFLTNKKIIILTSQEFTLNAENVNYKLFKLEHLHKLIPFILRYALGNHKNKTYLENYKEIKKRKYLASCLVRRSDLARLSILTLFLQNHNFEDIIYSYIDTHNFKLNIGNPCSHYGELVLHAFTGILPIDKNLFFKIYRGPKISAESLIQLSNNVPLFNDLKEYFTNINYKLKYNYRDVELNSFNKTFDFSILPYSDTKVNYIAETNILAPFVKEFLTEKSIKPILSRTPFVLISNVNSYKRLQRVGFETFENEFDSSLLDIIENTDLSSKLVVLDEIMQRLDFDFFENNSDLLQDKVNYNFDWLFSGFSTRCEKLNQDTIEEIQEYLSEI